MMGAGKEIKEEGIGAMENVNWLSCPLNQLSGGGAFVSYLPFLVIPLLLTTYLYRNLCEMNGYI